MPNEKQVLCKACQEEQVTIREIHVPGQNEPRWTPAKCETCRLGLEGGSVDRPRPTLGIHDALDRVGVNVRRHGHLSLGDLDPAGCSSAIVRAQDFCKQVQAAGDWDPVASLYLFGTNGVGKSQMAACVIRALLERGLRPSEIVWDHASRLMTVIQDSYGTGGTERLLRKREHARVWVLDDFGTERPTPDVLRILTDLFTAREGSPMVATSNYDPDELGARFDDLVGWQRLCSRLGPKNFRIVRIEGPDRRHVQLQAS